MTESKPEPVKLVAIDAYSDKSFVLYFSDETYTEATATDLAECFPDRAPIPEPPEE